MLTYTAKKDSVGIPSLVSTFVTTKTATVSRTTKGGRRRKISVFAFRAGTNGVISYALPMKAKAEQRFMATQKISPFSSTKKDRLLSLKKSYTSSNNTSFTYSPQTSLVRSAYHSTNLFNRSPSECIFFHPTSTSKLSGIEYNTKSKSSFTRLGRSKDGLDCKAEDAQYALLSALGIKNVFVKNHGARHHFVRVKNLVNIVQTIYPIETNSRKFGSRESNL
jgi:ribosomal protein S5